MSLEVHGGNKEGRSSLGVERRLEFVGFCLFWEGHMNRGNFKDSLLSRVIKTRETHPVKALDYDMRDGKAKITVQQALICYARKRLGLDTNSVVCRPQNQQIVPLDREVLDENH